MNCEIKKNISKEINQRMESRHLERTDKMRILIIGAGVLGSNLAHSIQKGHDITILARGKTYQSLKSNGLVIKHKLGKKTVDHFNVIDELQKNDIYNVIFIVSRYSSLDSIVPMIEKNESENIVFVGNNMTAEKYANLGNKNVLFAFFSAAGKKYDGYINSICMNKIQIGRSDGKNLSDEFINSISDHAMSAREEFILLDSEFEKIKQKSGLETKVYDKLKLDFENYISKS